MSVPSAHSPYERDVGVIAGIPVRVSAGYLLFLWLALSASTQASTALISFAVYTISVLVHELGHGLVAKRFGLQPRIMLHAFGGWCEHREAHSRDEDLRVVAGGPAAGLLLAAVSWAALQAVPGDAPPWLWYTLASLASVNLWISLLNLLPVLPLDGGRLVQIQLGRSMRQDLADLRTHQVGMVVAAAAALWLLSSGSVFLGLLLAWFGWQSWQAVSAGPQVYARVRGGGYVPVPTARQAPIWQAAPASSRLAGGLVVLWLISALVPFGWSDPVMQYGALVPAQVIAGQVWRLLSYAVLHPPGTWQEIAVNAVVILVLGSEVERRIGARPVLHIAGAAALAGALLTLAAWAVHPSPFASMLGASAIGFGLLFALAWLVPDEPLAAPFGVAVTARWLAAGVLGFDVWRQLTLGGLSTWPLHVGGALVGWIYLTRLRASYELPRPAARAESRNPPAVVIPLPTAEERERLRRRREQNRPPDDTVH